MIDEIHRLNSEWRMVNGEDIPYRILRHGIVEVRKALEHARKTRQPVTETGGNDDSLADWDAQAALTAGNSHAQRSSGLQQRQPNSDRFSH